MAIASHREAFELFRRALDNLPSDLLMFDRVRILLFFSDVASSVDQNEVAAVLAMRAWELVQRVGDRLGELEALTHLAVLARPEGAGVTHRRDLSRQLEDDINA